MSVEVLQIKPTLDEAALKRAEGKLDKAFSAPSRALKQVEKDVKSFFRGAEKISESLGKSRRTSKEWSKDLSRSKDTLKRMSSELREAERTLGRESKTVREMRKQMQLAQKAHMALVQDGARAVSNFERIESANKRIAAHQKSIAASQRKLSSIRESQAAARAERRAALPGRIGGAVQGGARSLVGGAGRLAAGGALGALALGGAAFASLNKTREAMDRAAKSANLTVREFGRLEHAATLSGTSIEVVEKSTQKLSSLLAKKPTAEFQAAMDALGLSVEDLQALSPEEQLKRVADGMQALGDDQMRTVVSSRLFGEEMGAKLVPLLQNGGQAIADMGDEAERLGIVFDEKAAAAAERFGDAQDKIKRSVSGLADSIAQQYMPALADATEGAVAWIMDNRDAIQAWIQDVVDRLIEAGQAAAQWVASVDWADVWQKISDVGSVVVDVAGFLLDLVGGLDGATIAFGGLALAATSTLGPLGAVAAAGAGIGYAIGSAAQDAKRSIIGTSVELSRLANQLRDIQRIAQIKAVYEEEDRKAEAEQASAQEALQREQRADRIQGRAERAANLAYRGRVPKKVQEQIARMRATASDPNASNADKQAVRAQLEALEGQAKKRMSAGLSKQPGKAAKPEYSQEESAIRSQIAQAASDAGAQAYRAEIARTGDRLSAERAAKKREKEVSESLTTRSGELARAGLLGQGRQGLLGQGSAIGGLGPSATPIAFDLAPKGGVSPVTVLNVPTTIEVNLNDPKIDADFAQISTALTGTVKEEIGRAWQTDVMPALGAALIR